MRGLTRICSTKVAASCCFIAVLPFIALKLLTADRHWYNREALCEYSEEHMKNQSRLAELVSDILEQQNVDFFLCYGSLFGALRTGKSLPWDPDLEFCLIDIGHYDEEDEIYTWFEDKNLPLAFDKVENLYLTSLGKVNAELVLFSYSEDFRRLERHLYYGTLDSFPSALVAHPLQKLTFHTKKLPVPNGDIDIQKYFYPDDWWKIVKPINCRHHTHDDNHHH